MGGVMRKPPRVEPEPVLEPDLSTCPRLADYERPGSAWSCCDGGFAHMSSSAPARLTMKGMVQGLFWLRGSVTGGEGICGRR